MCGIAGVYVREGGVAPEDTARVQRMNEIQRHRGPDDEGLSHDGHCVLGHRRLAIIDLSREARQPFVSPDGRFQMVYNGEIYNYVELRSALSALGMTFRTQSDTEVLLAAYAHYGPDCLRRLNGMFAFAVYDTRERTLFLARDRCGIKPLYYTEQNGRFYFASEIKALRQLRRSWTADPQSLFDYLVFNRTDIHDETFLKEIRRLPKGHYARLSPEGWALTRWWSAADYSGRLRDMPWAEACRQVDETLVSAVHVHMRSDVPVGSCLSGGLDSSILLGILSRREGVAEDYPAFTAEVPGHPLDETRYIDALRQDFPFVNHRTAPTGETCLRDLKDFMQAVEEPTGDASFYAQYAVMRLAKEKGITVLLDGQGGDELFAGYPYFHGFFLNGLLRQGRVGTFVAEFLHTLRRRQDRQAYETLLFQLLPAAIKERLLARSVPFVDPDFFRTHLPQSRIYRDFFGARDLNDSLRRHFDFKLEHLLRMEDRNAMAFSIEARVPYLDHRLVELVLGLREDFKIRRGETKYLQRQALGYYTRPEILQRTDKIGFGVPTAEWLEGKAWQDLLPDHFAAVQQAFPGVLISSGGRPLGGNVCWKIHQLAVWEQSGRA